MEFVESIKVPPILLAVHCPTRSRNLGTLIRTASASGAKMLVIVGENKVGFHGAFGSNTRIMILHFYTWPEAIVFLRSKRNMVHFYGVSPPGLEDESCQSLKECEFPTLSSQSDSVCFVVGARGEPLSEEILRFLDIPIKIDFPVPKFAKLLQFEEAFAIAIHHYVSSMIDEHGNPTFEPHEWEGEKFVKEEVSSVRQSSHRGLNISQILERSKRKEKAAVMEQSVLGLGALMSGGGDEEIAQADY